MKTLSQKHEDWQVKQAEKAISLYFYFTNGGLSGNANTDLHFRSEIPSDWKSVKEKAVRSLGLRHRFYRTERRLPVVLSRNEIADIFFRLEGTHQLMAGIIYGGGLRLQECLMLRLKDIDYERNCITVRSGKGDKDRQTIFQDNLKKDLEKHIAEIQEIYEEDRKNQVEGVWLPSARVKNRRGSGYSLPINYLWILQAKR